MVMLRLSTSMEIHTAASTLNDVNSGRVRESTIEKYLYTDETKEEYAARLRAEYANLE